MSGNRSIIGMILKNFILSFKPRQIRGNLAGKDYFGNKYYEIPADPSRGKRNPTRWFEPHEKEAFDQELPAEWEAWLRRRRQEPPTQAEIEKNLEVMKLKKKNALLIAQEQGAAISNGKQVKTQSSHQTAEFPKYEEYEKYPGEKT